MPLEIREIDTTDDEQLLAVASLRYQVNVQEMQLDMRHADHQRKTVIEPLDYCGHVFAAYSGHEVIGTMRQNLAREADVGEYFEAYGVSQLPTAADTVSVTTRLVIKKEFRRSRISLELPLYGYKFLLRSGISHDVIDSRPNLVPFFTKLGYRPHIQSWGHPEFGDVVVQYLAVEDEVHLANIGSPFFKQLKQHRAVL